MTHPLPTLVLPQRGHDVTDQSDVKERDRPIQLLYADGGGGLGGKAKEMWTKNIAVMVLIMNRIIWNSNKNKKQKKTNQ